MAAPSRVAPWIESGDRFTQPQFHRLYKQTPEDFHAELIEGIVYVASPVRYRQHDAQAALIRTLLGLYAAKHPGVLVGNDATLVLDGDNEFQPDAFLFREGGQVRERRDGFLEGAPELVVEVAASSVSRDLHDKKNVYRRSGVQEYIVWRVEDGVIDWFALENGDYVRVATGKGVPTESHVFPGLRLDMEALLRLDSAGALAALQ